MSNRFEVKIKVEAVYELIIRKGYKAFDQREGEWTDYKDEVHSFVGLDDVVNFLNDSEDVKVVSLVLVENKLDELKRVAPRIKGLA